MKRFRKENNQNSISNLSFQDRRFLRKQLRLSKKNPCFTVPSETIKNSPMVIMPPISDGMGGFYYDENNATLNVEVTKKYLREHSMKNAKTAFSVLAAVIAFFYKVIVDWKDEFFDLLRCLFSKAGG